MILNKITLSNIFLTWLLPARFYQNRQAVLAAVGINGLIRTQRLTCSSSTHLESASMR